MKNRLSLKQFIRDNRVGIDASINATIYRYDGNGGHGTVPTPAPRYNDNERREWVLSDEGLYRWAQDVGVRI